MQASRSGLLGFGLLALRASAIECALGSRLESGVCKDLQQEAPSSLELLQHSSHSVDKARHADYEKPTIEQEALEGDSGREHPTQAEVKATQQAEQSAKEQADQHALEAVREAEAMKSRLEAERKAREEEAAARKADEEVEQKELREKAAQKAKMEAEEKAWKEENAARRAAKEAEQKALELAAAQNATRKAKQKVSEEEKAEQKVKKMAEHKELEEVAAVKEKKNAVEKARQQVTAVKLAKQEAEQRTVKAAPKAFGSHKLLIVKQLPESIRSLLPDSVKDIVDRASNTALNGIVGIVNASLRTVDKYADNFMQKCTDFKDNLIAEVSKKIVEGTDAATKALGDIMARDVQPIQEKFDKIMKAFQDDGETVLSGLEVLVSNDTFAETKAFYLSFLDAAANISASLSASTSYFTALANYTKEEKLKALAQVDSLASQSIAMVSDFTRKFNNATSGLIRNLADVAGVSLLELRGADPEPATTSTMRMLSEYSTSVSQKLAVSFYSVIEGPREASRLVLQSETDPWPEPLSKPLSENSAAAGLGVQLGLSLAAACMGAIWL